MQPKAAKELIDLIMLDDFVSRRKALDTWTRRWVATAEVICQCQGEVHETQDPREIATRVAAKLMLLERMAFTQDGPDAFVVERTKDAYITRMHVILQEPYEEVPK